MARPPAPLSSKMLGLPGRPTLGRLLDFWLAHVAWQRLRFTTARTYSSVVVHIIAPVLGATLVGRLTSCDIEKAQLVWQRAGVKASMRRKAVEVLRSALRHAVALGLCKENPASRSRVPPKGVRQPTWLDVPQVRQLLAAVQGNPLEAAYALAVGLGLRRGEIIGLTWDDIDFAKHVLHVRWNRAEFSGGTRLVAPKGAASRRTLALPRFVERVLRHQHRREQRKAQRAGTTVRREDPVLTTRTRRPYWNSYLHLELQKRLRELGLSPMRFHDLRHTAASLMLAEGISPRTVMEMMGHRNLQVMMLIYGHVNLRHQRLAAAAVERALAEGPTQKSF
ncbi:MAG TPA: site-specific integrase [Myxococcales bacterium]|jgi:integrase